ncbi:hypothetical protein L873DRAFT_1788459 [Choiromyces venosus 120613-1]|uniref:Uncharacterized protein n=1 Tax=Choiromyces venosus 120613-1 TaxID=1336337 RepID=A0A3N4K5F6_9PEZI|nr:hypothetical protein L873DRAFT_1788459 [Choiromyces venosus 120613-1]
MPSQLRFHGYRHNGEDICKFLEAIEDRFDDRFNDCYSGRERSTRLAAYLLNHLRGHASRFAEGLPKSVHRRWSKLSSALEEKFDVYYPSVNLYHGQYDTESEYEDDDFEEASKPHPI